MFRSHLRIAIPVSCLTLVLLSCATGPRVRQGSITPPTGLNEPMLELRYEGGMIANPDPTPFVRVYPGGRVMVHYPAYTKRAGDYSLQLNDEELQALLASFSNEGVLTLQEKDLHVMAVEMRANVMEPQIDDHGMEAVVRIRGESFIAQGRAMMLNVDQTIRASADLLRAAPDSAFESLKSLAAGVSRLEELARSESLRKID
ncbi:MAG: hypothetical protein IH987_08490 [Planctomycetes bacterium]|nr:hypothetical protein [Planctomycetota bacterium]